jgi:hypothetical protein
MLKSVQVRDYMTHHQVSFRPDTDLFLAIERLLEHRAVPRWSTPRATC